MHLRRNCGIVGWTLRLPHLYPHRRIILALLLLGCLLLFPLTAQAADINVTAACDIYEAVKSANDNSNSHESACTAGSGSDTIILPTGGGTTTLTSTLGISSNITINGNGHTLSGGNSRRVINLESDSVLTVNNVAIANGRVTRIQDRGAGIKAVQLAN